MLENTLAVAVERLSAAARETLRNEPVERLVQCGFVATRRSTVAGMKAIIECQVTSKQGVVEVVRYVTGFKVLIVRGVVPTTCLRVDPAEVRRRSGLPAAEPLPAAA